jgi:hypothetical protein
MSAAPAPRPAAVPAEPDAEELETRAGEGKAAVIHLPDERQHGRKKTTSGSNRRQRSIAVLVRLHPADAARLKEEAAAAEMSLAGYLASGRIGAEAAPRPRIHRRRVRVPVAFLDSMVEFRRVNGLFNQHTRAVNVAMLFAEEHGAAGLAEEVQAWRQELEQFQVQFAPPLAAIHAALDDEREG